jgi:hypothetical protein
MIIFLINEMVLFFHISIGRKKYLFYYSCFKYDENTAKYFSTRNRWRYGLHVRGLLALPAVFTSVDLNDVTASIASKSAGFTQNRQNTNQAHPSRVVRTLSPARRGNES